MKNIEEFIDNGLTFIINDIDIFEIFKNSYIKYIKYKTKNDINIRTDNNKHNLFNYDNYDLCINSYHDDLDSRFTNIINANIVNNRSKYHIILISTIVFVLKKYNNGIFEFTTLKDRYNFDSEYYIDLNKYLRKNKIKYILNENA